MWIEVHQSIWHNKKTSHLASLLGADRNTAVALLLRLWHWALSFAEDGELGHIEPQLIEASISAPAGFLDHCREAGWIDPDGYLHEWHKYTGKLIARRQRNTERMQRTRAAHVPSTGAQPPTDRPTDPPTDPQKDPKLSTRPAAAGSPRSAAAAGAMDRFVADTIRRLEAELPGICRTEHDRALLVQLRTDYQTISLVEEATRCRLYHTGKPEPHSWARVLCTWVTNARSVRYIDQDPAPPRVEHWPDDWLMQHYPQPWRDEEEEEPHTA